MISPFSNAGMSLATVTVSTAIWLIVVQWLSALLGGYVAGRLRTKWVNLHTDEVFFRDTAHDFLAWALATLLVVGLLGSAISAMIGTGVQAASNVAASWVPTRCCSPAQLSGPVNALASPIRTSACAVEAAVTLPPAAAATISLALLIACLPQLHRPYSASLGELAWFRGRVVACLPLVPYEGVVARDVAFGVEADAAEHCVELIRSHRGGDGICLDRSGLLDRLAPDLNCGVCDEGPVISGATSEPFGQFCRFRPHSGIRRIREEGSLGPRAGDQNKVLSAHPVACDELPIVT
jgi:hypothetical protein